MLKARNKWPRRALIATIVSDAGNTVGIVLTHTHGSFTVLSDVHAMTLEVKGKDDKPLGLWKLTADRAIKVTPKPRKEG